MSTRFSYNRRLEFDERLEKFRETVAAANSSKNGRVVRRITGGMWKETGDVESSHVTLEIRNVSVHWAYGSRDLDSIFLFKIKLFVRGRGRDSN